MNRVFARAGGLVPLHQLLRPADDAQIGKKFHFCETFKGSFFGIGDLIGVGPGSQVARRQSGIIVRWTDDGVEIGFSGWHRKWAALQGSGDF